MTPAGVFELTKRNHKVYIQTDAGKGSGFFDEDYIDVGATILPTIEEVYLIAEMIVKVKEPIELEYSLITPNQIVFTYFHFASSETLTKAMMKSNAICILLYICALEISPYLIQLNEKINDLNKEAEYFKNEIKKDKIELSKIQSDSGLEKYAREVYHMKKENEDIYIIEHQDSIKK